LEFLEKSRSSCLDPKFLINKMNIVLFIRTHNDMDHALPILDYLIRVKHLKVSVYGVDNNYKKYTRHLSYMERVLSINITPFEDEYYSIINRKLLKIVSKLSVKKNFNLKLFNFFYEVLYANIKNIIWWLSSGAVRRFLSGLPMHTTILADVGVEGAFPYRYIIKYAQKNNFPVIAYHHGFNVFVNTDFHGKKDKTFLPEPLNNFILDSVLHKRNKIFFDRYLIAKREPGTFFAGTNNTSFKEYSKTVEIGIPRFSLEWMKIFVKTWERDIVKNDDKCINVALFISNVKFNVNKNTLDNIINELISLKTINFIIVPHTRANVSGINHAKYQSYLTCMSSTDVIEWADIGIVYGSSIGFQMLVEKVILLVPKFLDNNTTVYEKSGACIVSNTLENMMDFIKSYNKGDNFMDSKIVDKFINEYVYGGYNSYEEMMDVYVTNICN